MLYLLHICLTKNNVLIYEKKYIKRYIFYKLDFVSLRHYLKELEL